MLKHTRLLVSLPVAEGNCTHINVEVYYSKGGMNYFTSSVEKRGYYLSVQPITKSSNSVSFTAFTGVKQLVKEVGRFSPKILAEFVVEYELMNKLVAHVMEKNNIKILMPSKEVFTHSQLLANVLQTDINSANEQIKISTICG